MYISTFLRLAPKTATRCWPQSGAAVEDKERGKKGNTQEPG